MMLFRLNFVTLQERLSLLHTELHGEVLEENGRRQNKISDLNENHRV